MKRSSTTPYIVGAVALAAALAAFVALSSGGGGQSLPNPEHTDNAPSGGVVLLGDSIREIWTLGAEPGSECGVPLIPRCTTNGLTVYPQVYDSDNSTKPREFLRTCVKMYQDAGFKKIVPLFSASSGAAFLQEWIDECRVLKIQGAIYSLQRMKEKGITCGQLV